MMSKFILTLSLAVLVAGFTGCTEPAAAVSLSPTQPASMAVMAGDAKLEFEKPDIADWQSDGAVDAPRDFASWYEPWEPWPRRGRDKENNTIELGPRRDSTGTQILGGLFRSVLPESVVVTSADGSKTFEAGKDYKLNETWGQIANLNGGLGEQWQAKIKVECKYALQRIDLVQSDSSGKLSVKRGESKEVCPMIPQADAGCKPVAGVYIAPWKQGGDYAITAENIFPINPAPPVEPINPQAISKTLAKLQSGEKTTIALMGASITAGAEATRWWDTKNDFTAKDKAWRGRFIYNLRKMYPDAEINPVTAYRGGTTTQYGLEQFKKVVQPANPDLALVSFGGNDANGPIGGEPNNPPEKFYELMTELVSGIKATGCEVMIIVTMPRNPWLKGKIMDRWPKYREVMLQVGREQDVAVADVYAEWENMESRGIPYYTQLHNWNNHPGDYGHKVFADTILRFFEPK